MQKILPGQNSTHCVCVVRDKLHLSGQSTAGYMGTGMAFGIGLLNVTCVMFCTLSWVYLYC